MERFEMSLKNQAVRVWFFIVFPAIIIAIALFFILPYDKNRYVSIGLSLLTVLYYLWFMIYFKRKDNRC